MIRARCKLKVPDYSIQEVKHFNNYCENFKQNNIRNNLRLGEAQIST